MVLELSHSLLLHKELSVAAERIAGYVGRAGLELPYIDGLAGLVNVNVRDFVTAYTKSSALETTPVDLQQKTGQLIKLIIYLH